MAIAWLAPLGLVPWIMPRGWFYLWCRLPDDHDSSVIAQRYMGENVVFAPGSNPSLRARAILGCGLQWR